MLVHAQIVRVSKRERVTCQRHGIECYGVIGAFLGQQYGRIVVNNSERCSRQRPQYATTGWNAQCQINRFIFLIYRVVADRQRKGF